MTNKDRSIFESPVKGLKRKLDLEQDQEHLQRQFDNSISEAWSTLESQEGPVDQTMLL